MPPPVLISSATTLDALAAKLPSYVAALTEEFWPGPLTLVCEQQPSLTWDLGDARGTVAVRMPDHEVALALLERTGPLAVSSANLSGLPAATEAAAADGMLGESVEVVLDAGPSPSSEASTILDVRGEIPDVLRAGALSVAELNAVLAPLGAAIPGEPEETIEPREPVEEQPRELTSMLVGELRARARELGIKGAGSMRKAQLIEAIEAEDRG
jgi:tRNA threonylcarbamoyl adenosine modification protein (Sua5/YciO/YrdC/YwlC family)